MDKGNVWDERAQAYRDSAPHAAGPDLDRLVEWAGAGAGKTALDVGSGGGHLARRLQEAGYAVTTCDPSPGMHPDVICRARSFPFPGLPSISWPVGWPFITSRAPSSPWPRWRV